MKKIFFIFLLSIGYSCLAQQNKILTEKQIYAVMDENAKGLLKESKTNSVSIGIIKDGKTYTRHYGEIDKGKGNKANNTTLFEIASVTKVFTGTLIAKAVLESKINLDDDIRKYITGSYPNLEYKGTPVTIKDLVSFKSGFNKDLPDRREILKLEKNKIFLEIEKQEKVYTKDQFFAELKTVELDTLPGSIYKYSNASLQLAAHILENVYKKSYETLLQENILDPIQLKNTKLHLDKNEVQVNGYDENGNLMPPLPFSLWGASGLLKSNMNDITKFLRFELDQKNPVVKESQRNLFQKENAWNGYFWDEITVNDNSIRCRKHGGAFGTQNMFVVYPDYNMGISVIMNQSGNTTYSHLYLAVKNLEDDLKPFGKKSIGRAIEKKCADNIDAGIKYYNDLKKTKTDVYNFSDESELNILGYKLMNNNEIDSSIKIFKLLVAEFPNSGNPYDSLAEAYFNNKEYELSKQNYLRSLALAPGNTNAKDMLAKIEEITKK